MENGLVLTSLCGLFCEGCALDPIPSKTTRKKVLNYIFGNDPFVLDDFGKIRQWMFSDQEVEHTQGHQPSNAPNPEDSDC